MDLVELSRRVENIIRQGTVHSIDYDARRCRMKSGKLITGWLKWFSFRAGETSTWSAPSVGEQGLILSPSGETGAGFVLLGLDSDHYPAPSNKPEEHVIQFADGARIVYDHVRSHLDITGVKTADIYGIWDFKDKVTSHGVVLDEHLHTRVRSGNDLTGEPQK